MEISQRRGAPRRAARPARADRGGGRALPAQLSAILEAVGKVSELDLEGVPPTSHPLDLVNVLPKTSRCPSLTREEALANAPDPEGGFFGVPR